MAMKVGTENKRNVVIAVVLFCIVAYLGISQLIGGSSKPAPVPVVARPTTLKQAPPPAPLRGAAAGPAAGAAVSGVGNPAGPEAKKLPNSGLDPALHLEKLAASESIEYAGNGRNIFSANSAPVEIEQAAAGPRPEEQQAAVDPGPPPVPQPPTIDLKFFGYTASKEGKREAFLLHGEDIFEAAAGEIVNHRYKVVSVDPRSIQVTDLSYNNTQTLQLQAN